MHIEILLGYFVILYHDVVKVALSVRLSGIQFMVFPEE
jgi:hypothetical protein